MPFWTTGTITRTFGTPKYRVCTSSLTSAEPGRRSQLGAPYWYNWEYGYANSYSPETYARMVWSVADTQDVGTWEVGLSTAASLAAYDYATGIKRDWFVMNEPAAQWGEAGSSLINGLATGYDPVDQSAGYYRGQPAAAAARYSTLYQTIKAEDPYAKIYVGGCLGLGIDRTKVWWKAFVAASNLDEIQNQHVHLYPCYTVGCTGTKNANPNLWTTAQWGVQSSTNAADNWYTECHKNLGLTGEIIITETGAHAFRTELKAYVQNTTYVPRYSVISPYLAPMMAIWTLVRDNVMIPIKSWFDGQSNYKKIYWYKAYDTTNWPNSLIYNEDQMSWYQPMYTYAPTPLGTEWCL